METSAPPPPFDFRPLTRDDFAAVVRWKNAPHVRPWFGGGTSLDEVVKEYGPAVAGRAPATAFIVSAAGRAIGVMAWMRFGDFPEAQRRYEIDDPDTANCDILIGEADAAHRGLGPALIQAFLNRIVFADPRIRACVIDPVPENAVAIRAYEKAGFRFLRALPDDGEGNGLYLMELRREELGRPGRRTDECYLRPARPEEAALIASIDDDAVTLYTEAGLHIIESVDPLFFAHESGQWTRSAQAGRLLLACAPDATPIGFAALGFVDGEPHLQELAVRRAWMRRGVGRALLARAQHFSVRPGVLWLTTWDHIPWNRPFYERHGFERVAEAACGPELRAILAAELQALPAPEHRIAMRYRHPRR